MKKIFLTSGLVLCMACPAFADFASTDTGTVANSCDYSHLGVYSGPTQLDAIWNAKKFNVSYVANKPQNASNNVTGTPEQDTVDFDDEYSVSSNEPTLTGWNFSGWSADHNMSTGAAETTDYDAGDSVTNYKVVGNTVLTAQWTAKTTTVSYVCGSATAGSTAIPNGTATYDSEFEFAAAPTSTQCTPATGSEFTGWSCGTAGSHDAGDTVTWAVEDATITCTAQWGATTIRPSWNINIPGNTTWAADSEATTECSYGSNVTLPNNVPERPGYDFGGWKVSND